METILVKWNFKRWEQSYQSKQDEIHQIGEYLQKQGIEKITLIVASSIGADLGLTFLSQMKIPIEHTFLMEVNLHRFQD